jgi:membrane fusion protein, multidrug efflux system
MAQTTETEVLDPHENSQRAVLEHDSPDGNAPDKQPPKIKTPRLKLSRLVLLSVLLIAAAGALSWWLYARNYESTDDAQIEGTWTS